MKLLLGGSPAFRNSLSGPQGSRHLGPWWGEQFERDLRQQGGHHFQSRIMRIMHWWEEETYRGGKEAAPLQHRPIRKGTWPENALSWMP